MGDGGDGGDPGTGDPGASGVAPGDVGTGQPSSSGSDGTPTLGEVTVTASADPGPDPGNAAASGPSATAASFGNAASNIFGVLKGASTVMGFLGATNPVSMLMATLGLASAANASIPGISGVANSAPGDAGVSTFSPDYRSGAYASLVFDQSRDQLLRQQAAWQNETGIRLQKAIDDAQAERDAAAKQAQLDKDAADKLRNDQLAALAAQQGQTGVTITGGGGTAQSTPNNLPGWLTIGLAAVAGYYVLKSGG